MDFKMVQTLFISAFGLSYIFKFLNFSQSIVFENMINLDSIGRKQN